MSTITSGGSRRTGRGELRPAWQREWQPGDILDRPAGGAGRPQSTRLETHGQALASTHPSARARSRSLTPALVVWLAVYTLLNVGDLLSTYLGLQLGLREANPLMNGLLAHSGFGALIAYKLVVIVAVIGGTFALFRMHARAAYLTVYVCTALVFLAVAANVVQMALR